jgi:hypothetical protein
MASLIPKHNYNVLSPNFHIPVPVGDLYMSVCLFFCSQIGRPILGIYKSLTDTVHDCRNWERGCAVLFLGIHKSDLGAVCILNFSLSSIELPRQSPGCGQPRTWDMSEAWPLAGSGPTTSGSQ